MNLARLYAIVFGVVYTLVGIVGFFVAPTMAIHTLVIFPVNVLHNVVHLLVGLLGIGAFFTMRSVLYSRFNAVLFAILTLAGFLPQPLLGLVPLGSWDIPLHAATALLGVAGGWLYMGSREGAPARAAV